MGLKMNIVERSIYHLFSTIVINKEGYRSKLGCFKGGTNIWWEKMQGPLMKIKKIIRAMRFGDISPRRGLVRVAQ